MHVVLSTIGTEGDVRPFVALGLGLTAKGHRVTIATHADYEPWIKARGLGFRPIGASFKKVVESPEGRAWIESGDSLLRYLRATRETFEPLMTPWTEDAYEAGRDADAVVAHPFALGAAFAAEKRGAPAVVASLLPIVPSGDGDPVFLARAPRWRWLRRGLGRMALRGMGSLMLPHVNRLRAREGLPPMRSPVFVEELLRRGVPVLHLVSEHLVPRPSDWPEIARMTGFCFLEEPTWEPPAELARFLEGEPAPLYVGFGSMTGKNPQELAELTIRAVRRAKQRAVLVTGWGGARGLAAGDDVYVTDHVSHAWLLPRVRAVVHHGGAGTCAAGLRASKPTLVVAFYGDQPYWGRRVAAIGAGPAPLLKRELDEESLARAITATLSDASYADGASRAGAALSAEDGVATTIAAIEALTGSSSGRAA